MITIIYEDNHLLVVNKPGGLLTQPSGTSQENLEDLGKAWIKEKHKKKGNVFLEAIHRLDKAASGIVVFARTSKALSRLTTAVRNRQVKKLYHAVVEEHPPTKEGTLEHFIVHDDYKACIVDEGTPNAKLARLRYRTLEKENNRCLLEIHLETGRYHQIRAQLAAIGCPILGDVKYGSEQNISGHGIALHHGHLDIPHPTSGEMITFEAPPPWLSPH